MKIGTCEVSKATWICLDVSLHRIISETIVHGIYTTVYMQEKCLLNAGVFIQVSQNSCLLEEALTKPISPPISLHKSVSGDPTLSSLELCRETCKPSKVLGPNWTDTMENTMWNKIQRPIWYIYRDRREETATPNCQKHLAGALEDLEAILSLDLEGLYSTARVWFEANVTRAAKFHSQRSHSLRQRNHPPEDLSTLNQPCTGFLGGRLQSAYG